MIEDNEIMTDLNYDFKCFYHPERGKKHECVNCGKSICEECSVEIVDEDCSRYYYCVPCDFDRQIEQIQETTWNNSNIILFILINSALVSPFFVLSFIFFNGKDSFATLAFGIVYICCIIGMSYYMIRERHLSPGHQAELLEKKKVFYDGLSPQVKCWIDASKGSDFAQLDERLIRR